MTKTRLETFSDGVIAIIITIMVLELRPPEASWHALTEMKFKFLSYVISFLMLGIYWGNHHHLIHTIKEVNSGIMWANLHLLFWLSLMPFATAWMGENHFDKLTVAAYALLSDLCGLAYYFLMLAIRKGNQHNTVMMEVLQKQTRKGLLSFIPYTLAIPAAYIDVRISGILVIIVALVWIIPDKNIEKAVKEN
ncbi:MAG TPA: TMEM175 family protein [Chitinophagaceae bacterium]|nr:TMEM175 family protein [Chitinophagaceae bacterium]